MSGSRSQTLSPGSKDIDDGLLDFFELSVRFVGPGEVEHTRRVSDRRKGIRNVIHVERWSEGKELGRGGFGTVNLQSERSGLVRAVKKVPRTSGGTETIDSLREVLAMAYFAKEEAYFVNFHGWYQNDSHLFIAMEFFEHGDLATCVSQPVPEEEAITITYQVLEALDFMHRKNFAHRDLKPSNVFVVSKFPNWWVKLGDFGVSKRINNDLTSLHTTITTQFVAPEITGYIEVEDQATCYTNAVDLWSLGYLAHWLLTKKVPLSTNQLLPYCAGRLKLSTKYLDENQASAEAVDFIRRLLAPRPQARLTAAAALKQNWFKDIHSGSVAAEESGVRAGTFLEPQSQSRAGVVVPTSSADQKSQLPAAFKDIYDEAKATMKTGEQMTKQILQASSREQEVSQVLKIGQEHEFTGGKDRGDGLGINTRREADGGRGIIKGRKADEGQDVNEGREGHKIHEEQSANEVQGINQMRESSKGLKVSKMPEANNQIKSNKLGSNGDGNEREVKEIDRHSRQHTSEHSPALKIDGVNADGLPISSGQPAQPSSKLVRSRTEKGVEPYPEEPDSFSKRSQQSQRYARPQSIERPLSSPSEITATLSDAARLAHNLGGGSGNSDLTVDSSADPELTLATNMIMQEKNKRLKKEATRSDMEDEKERLRKEALKLNIEKIKEQFLRYFARTRD